MLLTDRRATVRLHLEMYYLLQLLLSIITLLICFSEFLLAYLGKSTLFGDHSLPAKVETGSEQSLAFDRGKMFRRVKWVNREVEISSGPVDRWFTFISFKDGIRPCKLRAVSFCDIALTNKLTTLSVRKKRSEDSVVRTNANHPKMEEAQSPNVIPVNHNEVGKLSHGNTIAQTVNISCYLWGGGLVVLSSFTRNTKGRGLNTRYLGIRSYSTKTPSEAPSWNDTKVAKRLESLWNGNQKDPNFVNEGLWKLIGDIQLWTSAYIKLSQSKGSTNANFDRTTIDEITYDKLLELRDDLLNGNYKFGTTKRLDITKANGKLGPLGIPHFKDQIVQEVVRTILEVIYEPIFSNHSHGFRPGRSCHTALRHVVQKSNGFSFCIEGDIQETFDNINHQTLLTLWNKKIKDPRFISLIHKMLKTKVREKGSKSTISLIGSPQGSVLSPLLSNILLHEFDIFMEDWIKIVFTVKILLYAENFCLCSPLVILDPRKNLLQTSGLSAGNFHFSTFSNFIFSGSAYNK